METKNKHVVGVDNLRFNSHLKNKRIELNYTQIQLAKKCNLHPSTISKYEINSSVLSLNSLIKVCEHLNIDYKKLINYYSINNEQKNVRNNVQSINHILEKDDIITMLKLEGYKIYKPIVTTTYEEII
jgi:transcriptional regulator with XRE-family HTH domain